MLNLKKTNILSHYKGFPQRDIFFKLQMSIKNMTLFFAMWRLGFKGKSNVEKLKRSFTQIRINRRLNNQNYFREEREVESRNQAEKFLEAFPNMHSSYLQVKRCHSCWYLPNLKSRFSVLYNAEDNIN